MKANIPTNNKSGWINTCFFISCVFWVLSTLLGLIMTQQFWHSKIIPEDVAIGEEAFQHATKYPHLSSATFNDISQCIESTWTYTDTSDLSSAKKYVCVSTIQEPYSTSR